MTKIFSKQCLDGPKGIWGGKAGGPLGQRYRLRDIVTWRACSFDLKILCIKASECTKARKVGEKQSGTFEVSRLQFQRRPRGERTSLATQAVESR